MEDATYLIKAVFAELTDEEVTKLARYVSLLLEWNAKINLISRKDIGNVVVKHILPCLSIIRVTTFKRYDHVLDIGTGGGLPGVPLAIVNPHSNFALLDSIKKKTVAVEDMVEKLGLKNIEVINDRAENIHKKFDKIIARAVINLGDFLSYASKLVKTSGRIFYLKGGDFADDLKNIKNYKLHNIASLTGLCDLDDKVILEMKF
jgi:16S rRNA (guanine527-N7)-methyltransferase